MITYYNLGTISSFFESNKPLTRQQCEDFTLSRAGGRVNPLQIQGAFSYTLTAGPNGSKVFQFQTQDSSFNIDIISLANKIYPQFIASCEYYGTISNSRPLHAYEMDKLPRTLYIMACDVSSLADSIIPA